MPDKKEKPLKDRPIYLVVRAMADPNTGELIGCLVPDSEADRMLMRERKYRMDEVLRASITHPRTKGQHRKVHHLGTLVRNNVPGFENLDSHGVIKRLQAEAGVFCELNKIIASPVVKILLDIAGRLFGARAAARLAKHIPSTLEMDVLVPQSIAYDCMDEAEFRVLWYGICAHLVERYWHGLTVEQVTEMAAVMPQSEGI